MASFSMDYYLMLTAIENDSLNFICKISSDRLRQLIDPTVHRYEGMPALCYAVYKNAYNIVKYMLSVSDIDVNVKYSTGRHGNAVNDCVRTPFSIAVEALYQIHNVQESDIQCARLLAQNERVDMFVNLQLQLANDDIIEQPVLFILRAMSQQQTRAITPLLIDIARNRSFDVNRLIKVHGSPEHYENTFFTLVSIKEKQEDIFNELIVGGRVDLTRRYQPFGRTALHFAVERNLQFAIVKLLEVMSSTEINARLNCGQRAFDLKPHNVAEHPRLLKLFIECPKVNLDYNFMSMLIFLWRHYHDRDIGEEISRRQVIERRIETVKLVDQLLANPRFQIEANSETCALFREAIQCKDEQMFMKLLDCKEIEGRHLRTRIKKEIVNPEDVGIDNSDGSVRFVEFSLLQMCMTTQSPCSIRVFEKMFNFAELRDEILQLNYPDRENALHMAISQNRPEVFKLFLSTGTENDFKRRRYDMDVPTLKKYATIKKRRDFIKIIDKFYNKWMSRVSKRKRGYTVYCL